MGGDRGVGGRLIAACYTFRVPRVISNFSVTRKKGMMVEGTKETRNIIYLSFFLILFSKVSMFLLIEKIKKIFRYLEAFDFSPFIS